MILPTTISGISVMEGKVLLVSTVMEMISNSYSAIKREIVPISIGLS
jgi:hypothetical protein